MHELAEQAGIELPSVLGKIDRNGMDDPYAKPDGVVEAKVVKRTRVDADVESE